jgi:ubiquinone/menaquinone biosynthesis C-methylase UbiE
MDFSEISKRYENDSIVQKSAGEILFSIIDIGKDDDVLDLGCGTGKLTGKIRSLTDGRVVGVDSSAGMCEEAKDVYGSSNIEFYATDAGAIDYDEEFDVIFCNSAFQWFKNTDTILKKCRRALRAGGRIGIQAPAKKIYSPTFLQAIGEVAKNGRTSEVFSAFEPPWIFLETKEDYAALFGSAGFEIPFCRIDKAVSRHPPGEVFTIFNSGASAGYLNRENYSVPLLKGFSDDFTEIVKTSFDVLAGGDGKLDLVFYRVYLNRREKVNCC